MDKVRLICFDIETCQTRDAKIKERLMQDAIEAQPAKNALKEIKLEWNTEAARRARAEEALAKTGLDTTLAEVLCTALHAGGTQPAVTVLDGMSRSERSMLGELAEVLDEVAGPLTVWVGHNIEGFDLPILLNRWRHFGIRPPRHFPVFNRGHWRGWVFDTMQRFPSKTGFIGLNAACEIMGIPGKSEVWKGEPMDGSRVHAAYLEGEVRMILEYCMNDVRAELELYNRLTCGDTWGTFGLEDDLADQVAEIDASGLSEGQKAIAKLTVLERAGFIPRVAA